MGKPLPMPNSPERPKTSCKASSEGSDSYPVHCHLPISIDLQEHRAQGNAINKNIIQKVQKVEELRRENRHNDASMLEAQVWQSLLILAPFSLDMRTTASCWGTGRRDAANKPVTSNPNKKNQCPLLSNLVSNLTRVVKSGK